MMLSTYNEDIALKVRRKKRKKRIAAVVASISAIGLTILILVAFNLLYVDRFTITTSNDPGLCLTIQEDKSQAVTTLNAPPLLKASDTQYSNIPLDIDEGLGSKNTDYYFAYTFYLGGQGQSSSLNYSLSMTLEKTDKALDDAIRVMIIRNGVSRVYAKPDTNGNAKPIYSGEAHSTDPTITGWTIPFKDNKHIILEPYQIVPGDYDRYTLVMWIDGWESVNAMKGGVFQANLKFSTISINER